MITQQKDWIIHLTNQNRKELRINDSCYTNYNSWTRRMCYRPSDHAFLNKLEDAIYTIDNNMDEITGYVDTFRESIDTADQTLQADINRVSDRVEEVNRNLSADVADVNRNWNEVRNEMDAFEDEIWKEVENKIVVTPRFGPSDSVNKEIKNLIENAYSGSTIKFPAGNWVIDESIDIHKPITILGDGIAKTTLNFVNCDGFNTYCSYVDIRDIRIYSTNTTSGEYTGVTINKHESQRVDQNNFKDVDISNFKNGILTIKHWNFVWDNLNINFCSGVGIRSKGLSVNNMISNSRIVSEDNGDYGILFDDSLGHSEGWNISNSLIYGFYENVAAYQMCHVQLTNSILDFARSKNIVLISRNNNVSGGWLLSNNYMATNGGTANIHDANNVEINNIAFGNTFSNNKIHDYKNGIYGIKIDTNANKNVIFGNRVTNYTNDICNDNANTIIANNLCMSNQDVNIITVDCICTNNVGKVSTDKAHSVLIRNRIYEVFSVPSDASIYSVGDIIIHTSPSDNSSGLYRVVATANGNIIRSIGDHIFKGRVLWSLASSPSEIYVSYPYTLPGAEDTRTILLTCECEEDMSVTVKTGSNTLSGFVIKINKKPTANNAVIHWVAY